MPLTITHIKSMYSRSPLFKAACIIGALLLLLGGAEVWYQIRVNNLRNVVDTIGKDAVESVGGINYYHYVHGEHVWNICVDTGPCPRVTESWFVLVDKNNDEATLINKIMQTLSSKGYQTGTTSYGWKGGVGIRNTTTTLEIGPITDETPPYNAPEEKEWATISASTYENTQ